MNKRSFRFFPRPDFRQQIAIALISGIILTAVISTMIISEFSARSVRDNLVNEGLKVTENLANQSTLGLLLFSPENVQDAISATLNFPDVSGVGIYDHKHKVLVEIGENAHIDKMHAPSVKASLVGESDSRWYFSAPVYSNFTEEENPFVAAQERELIGYVDLVKSKETLHQLEQSILTVNMWISLALAASLMIVLVLITQRVTNPLKTLMQQMHRAQQGDTEVRALLEGPRDIVEMEMAFNTMMEALEDRSRQLETARDAALESARIKGEFAANVSHELRTPLNGILGMLELLSGMGVSSKQQEYIQVARNSGDALLSLIDDILDFSRIDAGKVQVMDEEFNLRETLDDVIGILSNQARAKDLDLAHVISSDVPPCLRGDAVRLRQLLLNLGGNAIKFTENGEIGFFASRVSQDEEHIFLRFEVKDTGIGIQQEALTRIFDAFSQADGSTTRRYGGTGLGLAICKQLVEVLGGKLGVESEYGKGSTFWFEIPYLKTDFVKSDYIQARSLTLDKNILVVDDSQIVLHNIRTALEKWGATVECAQSAEEAFMKVEHLANMQRSFDIVFVDELMPGSNGIELMRKISQVPQMVGSKLIMLTNQMHAASFLERFKEIDSYLNKPVLQSALFDCIASTVGEKQLPEKNESVAADTVIHPISGHVLVAEDNRANQKVAIGMLERIGCKVSLAANGIEAVNQVSRNHFDLVLMDCNMPEMDGYEATQAIRQLTGQAARVPIVAMTANVQEGDRQKCLRAGMDDYLSKPLKLDKLRAKLVKWLPTKTESEKENTLPPITQQNQMREGPLNLVILTELQESVGPAYDEMLEVFCEDLPILLSSLEKALIDKDTAKVTHYAHSIKGSSKNFGADQLAEVAKQLEEMGKSGEIINARKLLIEIFERADEVLSYLKNTDSSRQGFRDGSQIDPSESARILIADDDRSIRLALANVLSSDGYLIDEVTDGTQAVAVCERELPDLVLLDAMMPEMGGFEACTRIRAMEGARHVPILIITALDDDESIEKAFNSGATDYVPKPVHFAVLRQRIGRLLRASQAERHVHQLAYNDPLTGLPNRTMFMSRLEDLLTKVRRQDEIMAILFLDLNRFKLVNDTLGHSVGDLLLKAVAERLQRCVRSGDIVARLGGDEFTVILDRVHDREDVARIAHDICDSLNRPFSFAGQEMFVSTSIGISLYPVDGEDIGSLMKHADTAMFRAKEQGTNFYFYENHMEAAVTRKVEIEADLRRSIDRDQIDVYYQPMADLKTREIIGMEALVRWNHPTKGIIRPDEFIPLAEETGLITEVGLWVMISACVQLQTWIKAGYSPYSVSVNLSGVQLEKGNIINQVEQVLEETGLDPKLLELEITESSIMHNPENVITILKKLKTMGVRLAVDDFGTGYSSLNYLKRFPIDMLKIDASFVRDIAVDPDDKAIIRGIIALAKSLRLKVIAEGVETREQEEFLREEGCDFIQGYYVGKPLASEEFEQRVLEQIKVGRSIVSDMSKYRGP